MAASTQPDSDQTAGPRRERLRRHWAAGEVTRFWAIVDGELLPELQRRLEHEFRDSILSREDVEDCCQEALWPFLNGEAAHVANPEPYIKLAAKNACIDEIRQRRRHREHVATTKKQLHHDADDEGWPQRNDGDDSLFDMAGAVMLVEEFAADVEAHESWVPKVVREALSRLSPALRRTVAYAMNHDPDTRAEHAAADLQVEARTYRSNKSRAFKALRELIPAVIVEMGIRPAPAAEDAIFRPRQELPSAEESSPDVAAQDRP